MTIFVLKKKSKRSGLRGEGLMKEESQIYRKYYTAGTVSPVSFFSCLSCLSYPRFLVVWSLMCLLSIL